MITTALVAMTYVSTLSGYVKIRGLKALSWKENRLLLTSMLPTGFPLTFYLFLNAAMQRFSLKLRAWREESAEQTLNGTSKNGSG